MRAVVISLAALGGLAFTSGAASAMPNGLPQAKDIASQPAQVEQVRWVCNPWGRCWWRPNWYGAYGYYRPHPYWGWRRWHHWHRW
jgi:hypothetical protein